MLPLLMKMSSQKLKGRPVDTVERAYDKIHAWFFAYPSKEFSLNDLARHLNISKTVANKVVEQLSSEGFLNVRIIGRLWLISVNPAHQYARTRKIPFHLKCVYESGIVEWVRKNVPNAKSVILFGSYRKGDDTEESDIDIAVEIAGGTQRKKISLVAKDIGYRKNVPIQVHIFSRKNVDVNLFNNIANGILLEGFLEVKL